MITLLFSFVQYLNNVLLKIPPDQKGAINISRHATDGVNDLIWNKTNQKGAVMSVVK